DENAADAELLGDARSAPWPRAAEREQGPRPQILAAFDRMHARRIGHVLIDHFANPKSGVFGGEIELGADSFGNAALGGAGVKPHLAAGKRRRIDPPKNEIGVGDGRLVAAAAVT